MEDKFLRKTIIEFFNSGLFTERTYLFERFKCNSLLGRLGLKELKDNEMVFKVSTKKDLIRIKNKMTKILNGVEL